MPGLVGFVGKFHNGRAETLLADMARALEPEHRFQVDLYTGEDWGLGRVSLGILNPEPQPIWNEDETLCLVMEGEVYDYQDLKQSLIDRGHRFRVDNDAEFVLHLFEEVGENFASCLNGAFVAAIWNQQAKELVLVNDRLGLQPVYYAYYKGRFTFGSGVRALLADPALPRSVDQVAIVQFLTFDHVLGTRTLLTEAHLLPPASLLTFCDSHLNIRAYWTLKHPDTYELRSEAEWIEDLLHYLRQAVARQAHDDLPAGILLSGGLDSRVLVAFLRNGPITGPFRAFTWGIPGCDDARYAREVSRKLGVQDHFFELKPDWLLGMAEEGVRITDGLGNVVNLHALATLEAETEYAQTIYKGFMGDALMGFFIKRQFLANYDETGLSQVFFNHYPILFGQTEQRALFTEDFQRCINDVVFDSPLAIMAESGGQQAAEGTYYFDLRHRQRRMGLNGVEVVRSRAIVRTPYCDKDLVEFMLTVPPGLRSERYLLKKAFIQAFPNLAKVPYTETGLPLINCARDVLIRADYLVRWHLRAVGLRWVSEPKRRPYANYNAWFRTVLRSWLEEILLNKHTLQHGYFNPNYIRQLVAEHMAGANHTVKLGALLSLELWHRQFLG